MSIRRLLSYIKILKTGDWASEICCLRHTSVRHRSNNDVERDCLSLPTQSLLRIAGLPWLAFKLTDIHY